MFDWIPREFNEPWRLLLLVLIPLIIVAYILASRRKNRRGMRYTNTSMLAQVMPKQSQWRRHLAFALSLLSLVTLTVAFAEPVQLTKVPRERATIVLVLDVSRSMEAKDVSPDRITVAKEAATRFVNELPRQYNVALIAMSGNPQAAVDPTQDHQVVLNAINNVQLRDSTAIGDSLTLALNSLQKAPKGDNEEDPAPGAIVLLSDGQNTSGIPAVQGAQKAKEADVPVYTIAYGTENGYVDLDGERLQAPVDREELAEVAKIADGKAYQAKDAGQLNEVYQNIGSEVGYEDQRTVSSAQWAGYGLAFAVGAALAAISLAARWP